MQRSKATTTPQQIAPHITRHISSLSSSPLLLLSSLPLFSLPSSSSSHIHIHILFLSTAARSSRYGTGSGTQARLPWHRSRRQHARTPWPAQNACQTVASKHRALRQSGAPANGACASHAACMVRCSMYARKKRRNAVRKHTAPNASSEYAVASQPVTHTHYTHIRTVTSQRHKK
jgi:hypothetical protein